MALHNLAGDASFPAEEDPGNTNKFRWMMALKETHVIALWTFLYAGIEVTIGGWLTPF